MNACKIHFNILPNRFIDQVWRIFYLKKIYYFKQYFVLTSSITESGFNYARAAIYFLELLNHISLCCDEIVLCQNIFRIVNLRLFYCIQELYYQQQAIIKIYYIVLVPLITAPLEIRFSGLSRRIAYQ